MNRTMDWIHRMLLSSATILVFAGLASGQVLPPSTGDQRTRREISGLAGGSGLLSFDGGVAADGMWSLKAGIFSRGRFGAEGTFDQSIREPGLRYLGGDFVFQFLTQNPGKTVPFVHVGAGSFIYGSHATGALSFGAGIKHQLNDHLGIRIGVQDRMSFLHPEYHRLDFYGGVFFRF